MGKAKRFTDDEVGNGLKYIQGLPHKAGKTQVEVAAIYAPSIAGAMKRGYSLEEIQEGLAKTVGVSIQMTKFKTALEALANNDVPGGVATPDKEKPKKSAKKTSDTLPDQTDKEKKSETDAKKPDEPKNETMPDTKTETVTPQPEQEQDDKNTATSDQKNKDQNADSGAEKKGEDTGTPKADNQAARPTSADSPILYKERINLNCKKEEQDHAKSLGALWDHDKKVYFVPPQMDLRPFEKMLPKALSSYAQQ